MQKVLDYVNENLGEPDLNVEHLELGEEIPPELTIQYAQFARAEGRAVDIVSKFDNGNHTENEDIVNGTIDIILDYPHFTDEDINEVLANVYSKAQQEAVEEKIEKVTKSSQSKPKKKEEVIQEDNGYDLSWDDL